MWYYYFANIFLQNTHKIIPQLTCEILAEVVTLPILTIFTFDDWISILDIPSLGVYHIF